MYRKEEVKDWQSQVQDKNADEIISWSQRVFGQDVVLASSIGPEDQILTHLIGTTHSDIKIFTLDTGRLFPETYDLIEATEKRYGIKIQVYLPDNEAVEAMVAEHGLNLFYTSVEKRKLCCGVRKLFPLTRALSGASAWICGLRRDQGITRGQVEVVEWDEANGMAKINPLWNWSDAEVWDFIRQNAIPYNPLHDKGFLSIGCSCCTRAVAPGEDIRSGRWWWENPEHKECGLHIQNGRPVRAG